MCGITGIFDTRSRRDIPRGVLVAMNDAIAHRGPDDDGFHFEAGVGLGHRRLSIIDLSTGHQPLYNEDGTVGVVFNGEIYNYQELVVELSARGHVFRTRSDTEVIVHAWEEWGEACVTRFRGMFAFGLWDRNRETLFLARDRLGVKPLFYAELPDGMWLFGSELKSLLDPRWPAARHRSGDPSRTTSHSATCPSRAPIFLSAFRSCAPAPHRFAMRRGQSASPHRATLLGRRASTGRQDDRRRRGLRRPNCSSGSSESRSSLRMISEVPHRRLPVRRRRLECGGRPDGGAVARAR